MKFVVQIVRKITQLAEVEIEASSNAEAIEKANQIRENVEYGTTDSDYDIEVI